jgi:hypothetical protein
MTDKFLFGDSLPSIVNPKTINLQNKKDKTFNSDRQKSFSQISE